MLYDELASSFLRFFAAHFSETASVAFDNHSRSARSRSISSAAKNFGPLLAGLPSGFNKLRLINVAMSCSSNPRRMAVV